MKLNNMLPNQKEIERIKAKAVQAQNDIVYESDEDEGAAEYHAEVQSVIDACNEALAGKNSLARVLEAAEWVGFSIKTVALVLLISACGGGGGSGSGGASSSPIIGQWLEQFANPVNNIYLLTGANSFALQQGSCTITGLYTVDANYLHITNVTESPACLPQPHAFDCTFSMASNNQLQLVCPGISANLTRQ